jgi:hypothetical protein
MAVIIVEDGSIVAGANSYVSESELTTYATDRGITLTGSADVLIIKSMDYIESQDFIGTKSTQDQPLQWPRNSAYIDGYLFPSDEIPEELKDAQMATAISIDMGVDPLSTVERAVKKEKVDVIEIEYMDNAASYSIARTITASLRKLITGSSTGIGNVDVWRV